MKHSAYKIAVFTAVSLLLTACGDDAPAGPDFDGIETRDRIFYAEIFNRCSINNTTNDCNCVARVNLEHRTATYETYAADYDSIHKPAMEAEISTRHEILVEKTKNRSDERVLEALEEDLHRLEAKYKAGIDDINNFKLAFLPAGATDACIRAR